jgi:hypothetical protein
MCTDDALQELIDSPSIPEHDKPAMRAELAERLAPEAEAFGWLQDGVLHWSTLDEAAEAVSRGDGGRQLVRIRGAVELLTITGERDVCVGDALVLERTVTPTGTYAQAGDLPT